jgi:hypothetical protein
VKIQQKTKQLAMAVMKLGRGAAGRLHCPRGGERTPAGEARTPALAVMAGDQMVAYHHYH